MIKCLTIDDEPLALDILEDFISRVPFLQLEKGCTSAMQAIEILHQQEIHLLFLDIQMPQVSGVQFLKSLETKPKVIFTTAYTDYALEGFNLDAIDYLLKPFTFERFLKAANKAYQQFNLNTPGRQSEVADDKEYMFVKSGYDTVKVRFDEITYIEGLKDYVKIHTTGKTVIALMSMKTLEDTLPGKFIRVHRSYIIDFERIRLVQKRKVFIEQFEIPIGEVYRNAFMDRLARHS